MRKIIFEEDFNQDNLDLSKWNIEVAGHGFGNNEDQFYTNKETNLFLKDSLLHIVGRKEKYEHRAYTSAKITTKNKVSFLYGTFEVRMKLPKGKGTWPALWFLGNSINDVGWPACGEIDFLEHVGKEENDYHFSLHSKNYNHMIGNNVHIIKHIDGLTDDFHIYKMIWNKDGFEFYIDDIFITKVLKEDKKGYESWPFDEPFYLIVNLALGGWWGGEIDDSMLPQTFLIDYIKVYEDK